MTRATQHVRRFAWPLLVGGVALLSVLPATWVQAQSPLTLPVPAGAPFRIAFDSTDASVTAAALEIAGAREEWAMVGVGTTTSPQRAGLAVGTYPATVELCNPYGCSPLAFTLTAGTPPTPPSPTTLKLLIDTLANGLRHLADDIARVAVTTP